MNIITVLIAIVLMLPKETESLTVNVEGYSSSSVQLIACVFKRQDYLSETPYKEIICTLEKSSNQIILKGIPDGEYSIFLFEDLNYNQELDLNFLGIPKESFGFSQNPSLRLSAPSFEQTAFTKKGSGEIQIKLKRY